MKFVLNERKDRIRFFVLDTVDVRSPQPDFEIVISRPDLLTDLLNEDEISILGKVHNGIARFAVPVVYEAQDGQFFQVVAAFKSFDAAYSEFANDIKPGRMVVDAIKGDNNPIVLAKKNIQNQITIDGIVVKSYIDIRQPAML